MDLNPTEEQRALAAVLREFLESAEPTAVLRDTAASDSPFDRKLWARLATEIGLHGILLPESVGGSDGDLLDIVAAFEELGRSLLAGPYLASAVQAPILLRAAPDLPQTQEWSTRLAAGELVVSVPLDRAAVHVEGHAETARVTGTVGPAPFLDEADLLLLVTSDDELLAVPLSDAPTVDTSESVDPAQRFGMTSLTAAPGVWLAQGAVVAAAHARATKHAATALAAEQTGAAQKCLDMAQAYAKERRQFGRAIGSFQAIKHLLADMFIEVSYARRITWLAAWELQEEAEPRSARAAWSHAANALQFAASSSIQIHGGIGITWEHDAHWYLKRALATKALFGTPSTHHDALASALLTV
ncbi:acyl-CoA dehydrogenase family protein [Pseudonocardia halophobica]|uniref:acyl-CoA dehydrogenase family protein n=1 Tax=Pseudonocardia halophobica TaxID=29401 RepID=UPI003D89F01B